MAKDNFSLRRRSFMRIKKNIAQRKYESIRSQDKPLLYGEQAKW